MQGTPTRIMYQERMPVSMSFTDLEQRILDRMDKLEDKLDKTCNTVTKMNERVNNHLDNIEKKQRNKDRKFYAIIAIMGIGFAIIQFIQQI